MGCFTFNMRNFLVLFTCALLALGTSSCGKKKSSSNPVIPTTTSTPPPVINPQATNPNLYSTMPQNYCGAYQSNIMNPYSVQYTYDPTYSVDWYSYGGVYYYYYQGYYWYYGDCNNLYTYAPVYYYDLVYYPTVCYTCQNACYSTHCGTETTYVDPNPVDDYTPPSHNTCTGKYNSFYKSITMNADLYNSKVYTKYIDLNESQTYYLVFEGKYTGAKQTNEKAEICVNADYVKTVKDLDNSSSNSGTGNIYTKRCYIELCLNKGSNKFQFRGRWDSLYMNRFELTTTKPSLPSCD